MSNKVKRSVPIDDTLLKTNGFYASSLKATFPRPLGTTMLSYTNLKIISYQLSLILKIGLKNYLKNYKKDTQKLRLFWMVKKGSNQRKVQNKKRNFKDKFEQQLMIP